MFQLTGEQAGSSASVRGDFGGIAPVLDGVRELALPRPDLDARPRRDAAVEGRGLPNVLAFIPARGGSKGIKDKNIKDLCGKPLVAYSIEAALRTPGITKVVVSTEDDRIAGASREYAGVHVVRRPEYLSSDSCKIVAALEHATGILERDGWMPDCTVTLLPTHPFRSASLMNELVDKCIDGFDLVQTVRRIDGGNRGYVRLDDGSLTPLRVGGMLNNVMYRPYGVFVGSNRHPRARHYIHVLDDPITLVDIDYPEDFAFAREVIENRMFDFHA